jgi:muconate cycloisomerase
VHTAVVSRRPGVGGALHQHVLCTGAGGARSGLADARQLARAGACDLFSIYIGKAGGIGPARAIADFALEQSIACTPGSNLELGVGPAAMIHLVLAHRAFTPEVYPCDIIGPFDYEAGILKTPLALEAGRAREFGRPGLVVELDETMVEKYRVR